MITENLNLQALKCGSMESKARARIAGLTRTANAIAHYKKAMIGSLILRLVNNEVPPSRSAQVARGTPSHTKRPLYR
jgi:hypothetical protein